MRSIHERFENVYPVVVGVLRHSLSGFPYFARAKYTRASIFFVPNAVLCFAARRAGSLAAKCEFTFFEALGTK